MASMQNRPRNHPHTRQEWEAIRPIFTRLYKVERMKLSDIVAKLADEHGFQAKELHYKRRIYVWGLDRKKKESDMSYAALTIQQRQALGKDTKFTIRGEDFTSRAVQKYWRRKKSRIEDVAHPPATPPGMKYWTPSPSPAPAAMLSMTPNHSDQDENIATPFPEGSNVKLPSKGGPADVGEVHFDEEFPLPSIPVSPLMIPRCHETQEKILFHGRACYQICIERHLNHADILLQESSGRADEFYLKGLSVIATLRHGSAPYSVKAARIEMYHMIPELLTHVGFGFLFMILELFPEFLRFGQKTLPAFKDLLSELIDQATQEFSSDFPLTRLLEAFTGSSDDFIPCTKMLLQYGEHFVLSTLGPEHEYDINVWISLFQICWVSDDWAGSLHYAKLREQGHRRWSETVPQEFRSMLYAQLDVARCYSQLRQYDQAETQIQETLEACTVLGADWAPDIYSRLLYNQAYLRYLQGRVSEARDLAEEALIFRLAQFGPSDWMTNEIVHVMPFFKEQLGTVEVPGGVEEQP